MSSLEQPETLWLVPVRMMTNMAEVMEAVVRADTMAAFPAVSLGHLPVHVAILCLVLGLVVIELVFASSPEEMSTIHSEGASSDAASSNWPGRVGL